MGTYKLRGQNKCCCVSTGQDLRLENKGAGSCCLDVSHRHAVFGLGLLHSLPQDFITNPNVQHRRRTLPVFSLWVEEMLLMRQGSAWICLMTRKADSSTLTLPVLAKAHLFFFFFLPHSAFFQQGLPTYVDPETPRLVSVMPSPAEL